MASAKQIAWRKKFAKMAKSGKFKKSKKAKPFGSSSRAKQFREKSDVDFHNWSETQTIVHPKNFSSLKGRDNMAYVEHQSNGKYSVVTFRKHSTPQIFVHKNFEKKRAIDYVDSFNFLNK